MKIYLTVLCPCNKIQDGSKILVDQYIGISHHKNQYRLATSPKHHWSPLTRLTVWTRRIKNKKIRFRTRILLTLLLRLQNALSPSFCLSLSIHAPQSTTATSSLASFSMTFLPLSFPFNQKIFLNQSSLVHFHIVHSRDQGTGTVSCGGASQALKVKVSWWRRQWQLSALGFISDGVSHYRFMSATHPAFKSLPLFLFIGIHYC